MAALNSRSSTPAIERQLGDERARYRRRSLRDRGMELIDWLKAHPGPSAVLALFLGVMAIQLVVPARSALPADVQIGDCLYLRTPQSMDVGQAARPIGDPVTVESVLMGGGAEQAGCNTSHGHEVSARVTVPAVPPVPSGVSVVGTVRAQADAACATAFPAYVGHPLAGSIYETFGALPPTFGNAADVICLVARRDGQWMTHPARASGE